LKILEDRILDLEDRGTFHYIPTIEPKTEQDGFHHVQQQFRRRHPHIKEEILDDQQDVENGENSIKQELENVTNGSVSLDDYTSRVDILSFDVEEGRYDAFMDDEDANLTQISQEPPFRFSLPDVNFKFAEEDDLRDGTEMDNEDDDAINRRIQQLQNTLKHKSIGKAK
jgi:hypothetical protein